MKSIHGFTNESRMFLKSAPVKVRMAGFESTTVALQNQGWQISVEAFHLMASDGYDTRVAFRHDGIKQVAIGIMQFDRDRILAAGTGGAMDYWKHMGIDISAIAPLIQCHIFPMTRVPFFQAIDARPEWVQTKTLDLNDIACFKPIKGENFEIYINQKDEAEILEILLKKQDIKKAEFIKNQKRREYRESQAQFMNPSLEDHINRDVKHQLVVCA